jgi:hypothetical protein
MNSGLFIEDLHFCGFIILLLQVVLPSLHFSLLDLLSFKRAEAGLESFGYLQHRFPRLSDLFSVKFEKNPLLYGDSLSPGSLSPGNIFHFI